MKQNAIRLLVVIPLLVLICVLPSMAQISTASITGVVQDASGAVVPNAEITVTQTATNYTAKANSNTSGMFSLSSLPLGPYTLTVKAPGFAGYKLSGLVLTVGQVANVQVGLKVSAEAQTIDVNAQGRRLRQRKALFRTSFRKQLFPGCRWLVAIRQISCTRLLA